VRQISQAAWECADPGMQYDDTINDWHTAHETGRINGLQPVLGVHAPRQLLVQPGLAEPAQVPATTTTPSTSRPSCKAVEVIITAMDISICFADFPTEPIGETTRNFRQLGIGYANLGALLMATGLPYDSDGGRAWAAAITALMTGARLRHARRTAAVVGPYAGYAATSTCKRVMRKHREAAANDVCEGLVASTAELLVAPSRRGTRRASSARRTAWRNAQASVLAPTGTIGFMMDCDTTGIEPDFSAGEVQEAGRRRQHADRQPDHPACPAPLGYAEEQIDRIVEYIDEHGTSSTPRTCSPSTLGVRLRHGRQPDHPMGHVRMMAAVQPFISGAISKTVNMPETARSKTSRSSTSRAGSWA
jgi:ribonucleoside-diphosphate reductase alpha chain